MTDELRRFLTEQLHLIEARKKALKPFLNSYPDKTLHLKKRGDVPHFYEYSSAGGKKERIIPKTETERLNRLALKKYSKTVLPVLEKDYNAIRRFLTDYSWQTERHLAESLDPEILKLCGKAEYSASMYAAEWASQTWPERPNTKSEPTYRTMSGLLVRSKSEEFIVNALFIHKIYALYEKPLYLEGYAYPIFPDLTILHPRTHKEVLWDHYGMMDDPLYADKACRKTSLYLRNGYIPGKNLILTYESSGVPFSSADAERIIREFFC